MSRKIYVIRHVSTELNEDGRIRGWVDVPPSEKGLKEADSLAQKLKGTNIGIIFHSDFQRARKTAAPLAELLDIPSYGTKLLRPWNLGDYSGRSSSQVHPEIVSLAENDPDKAPKGGESFNTFLRRARRGIRHALENSKDKPLAIVTHHRVERALKAGLMDGEIDHDIMFQHGEDPGHAEQMEIEGAEGPDVTGPKEAKGDAR